MSARLLAVAALVLAPLVVAGVIAPAASALPAAAPRAAARSPVTAPAAGAIGVRLLDAPGGAAGDPRARLYIVDHLDLGAVIHRRLEVINTTPRTAELVVYPAAAAITDGTFSTGPGHARNELSGWITADHTALSVPANSTAPVTVTITVPPDASPGERYAVVWVEATAAPPASGGVRETNRVGVRAYLSVGPGGAPAADFTIDTPTADRAVDAAPRVTALVHNTGGRALDIGGTLTLTQGPGGLQAGPFPVTLGTTLAPGDTGPVTATLDPQLPTGPWTATLTLTSGLLQRTTTGTLQFPAGTGTAPPVTTATAEGPLSPGPGTITATAAIALAALLALLLLYLRHRRRARAPTGIR